MVGEISDKQLECFYIIKDLKVNTAYYVIVTAVNGIGEGYKTEVPCMIRTVPQVDEKKCSMYVWGSNTYSEIGLTQELVN
jgi:hypothetical protein